MTRATMLILAAALASPIAAPCRAADAPAGSPGYPEGLLLEKAKSGRLQQELDAMISRARDRVFPALVNIEVVMAQYWEGRDRKEQAVGSGTIISADGYVLTNQHVVDRGKKFTCTLGDKQKISATLVAEDQLTDLAVLKLNLKELKDPAALPVGEFGDSSKLKIGDYVMAMGSPFALSRSVTLGIVSNTERILTPSGRNNPEELEIQEGLQEGLFNSWIQHDALINPGNSGGPLVSLEGEIVGVNARGGSAMGFAIPSNLARAVADSLIHDKEVKRSWFGLGLRSIDDTSFKKGVMVNSVVKNGPADKAGIQPGDLLLSMDGADATVVFAEQAPPLLKRMAGYPIGAPVKIAYEREGKPLEASLSTEKMKVARGDEGSFHGWGLTACEITDVIAREWKLETPEGALVTGVRQGGPSQLAEPPVAYGDVLRAVAGKPVSDYKSLVEAYKSVMDQKPLPEWVMLEFDRKGKRSLTLVKPKPDQEDDPPREVAKAWIGVATQPVLQKLAEQLALPGVKEGFRITRVYPGTKAAAAGLQVGDVIAELNGSRIAPKGMQDAGLLDRQVRKLQIGETAKLKLLRGGAEVEAPVELERTRLTQEEAPREKNRDFEIAVRDVTFFDRDEARWDDGVKGVLVESVESAGWAELGGIKAGDLIQKIGGQAISGVESFRKAMEKIAEEKPERVVAVVLRGPRTYFQFIEPEWKPDSDGKAKP